MFGFTFQAILQYKHIFLTPRVEDAAANMVILFSEEQFAHGDFLRR